MGLIITSLQGLGWWGSIIGLHPMVRYLAPSGLRFLVKRIITLKGLHLLSMGTALRIGQLPDKALKGRNRNLLLCLVWFGAYLIRQRSVLGISYHAPSGLRFLVKRIITLKGLHLLSMGTALRIGQLPNKALKGRNRNLLLCLGWWGWLT